MNNKYPAWLKIIGGALILFSSIGVYSTVVSAAAKMSEAAYDMIKIRSVSGNSIDEAFYQEMGRVYYHMADIISNAVGIVLIVGIAVFVMLVYSAIASIIHENRNRISSESPMNNIGEKNMFCSECGRLIDDNAEFCIGCGNKIGKHE